jgi:hypothetical protein
VDSEGNRTLTGGGVVETPGIGNNAMEYVAIGAALASIVERYPGWSGFVYSDSKNALGAVFSGWACKYAPEAWRTRMREVVSELGLVMGVLVSGHPTRSSLRLGSDGKGVPVSVHNVWCDNHCKELRLAYKDKERRAKVYP